MSTRQLFYLILTIGFSVMLASCEGEREEASFTENELSWLSYNANDTISFKEEVRGQENWVVNFRTDLTQLATYYPIEAEVELMETADSQHFRIYLLKDKDVFKKYFKLGEVYRSLDLMNPVDSVVLDGKMYNGVYIITEDTTNSDIDIWQVYYKKKKGVLRYVRRDNTIYTADLP